MSRERESLPTRVRDTPDLPAAYGDALERGLASLGLDPPGAARAAMDGHVRLLAAWTRSINLTAIREPAAMAVQHVTDSLSAYPLLSDPAPELLLDLGSGGGFPGIPLAAMLPATATSLLEPIAKKARFLQVVVEATDLADRADVRTARAEALARDPAARGASSVVTARAVAPLGELVEMAFPLLAPGGRLVAWKRGDLAGELSAARRALAALGGGDLTIHDVQVEGLGGHRLVVATPTGRVPDQYPRDPAARRRRPW